MVSRLTHNSSQTRRRKLIARGLLGAIDHSGMDSAIEHFGPPPVGGGWTALRRLFQEQTPLTIVASGDNLLAAPALDSVERNLVERFGVLLRQQKRRGYDVLVNSAVRGDTLDRLVRYWQFRVQRFRPQVVLLSLGVNDCKRGAEGLPQFVEQLAELHSRLSDGGQVPLILVPHPINFRRTPQRLSLADYATEIANWCAAHDYACLDLWSHWQRHWPTHDSLLPWLADERLHLSAAGQGELLDWLEVSLWPVAEIPRSDSDSDEIETPAEVADRLAKLPESETGE